jgi:transcription elongation GreA/GreB family factor
MYSEQSEPVPFGSESQLQQTRNYLQKKLKRLSKRLSGEPPTDEEGGLTFALAERNFLQGKLERIERQLLLAKVSSSVTRSIVGVGSTVYIQRGNDIRAIMLIPAMEDVDNTVEYVSAKSTLGKALLGKRENDSVEISTSLGKQNYGVLRIA